MDGTRLFFSITCWLRGHKFGKPFRGGAHEYVECGRCGHIERKEVRG